MIFLAFKETKRDFKPRKGFRKNLLTSVKKISRWVEALHLETKDLIAISTPVGCPTWLADLTSSGDSQ